MLIEFSVENFKSIKELNHLNMVASNLKSKHAEIDRTNVIEVSEDLKLLKSVAIYGGNSSGKSNMIKAMISMLVIIRDVMAKDDTLIEFIEPFYFDDVSQSLPTYFQMQFILDKKKYRYGFEATANGIESEWLYGPAEKTETFYFEREKGKRVRVNQSYFKEGVGLDKNLKETNLFLNVVSALNGALAERIKDFFSDGIFISLGVTDTALREFSIEMLKDDESKKQLLNFLNLADFGITDLLEEDGSEEEGLKGKRKAKNKILGMRPVYNQQGERLEDALYYFDTMESLGTIKLFNYAGSLLTALKEGLIFVIDEFDARMHPILSKRIVEMFDSTESNKHGAQLIFVTHDSNLLDNKLLRRDQIYFAEKDSLVKTSFYSLFDIKGVRSDASYEKDYIQGKYGAIPYLGDFNTLFNE